MHVQAFPEIINFDNGQADNPDLPAEGSRWTMGNVLKDPKMVSRLDVSIPAFKKAQRF
jgi:multifunctional beta-oxidation protein